MNWQALVLCFTHHLKPTPCRLEKELWLALDESKDQIQSKVEWNKYLSNLDSECDFQDLLDKMIILPVEATDDKDTEPLIDDSPKVIAKVIILGHLPRRTMMWVNQIVFT